MHKKGIILSILAIILVGNAFCETTRIPALNDVYIILGTGNEQVYNQERKRPQPQDGQGEDGYKANYEIVYCERFAHRYPRY